MAKNYPKKILAVEDDRINQVVLKTLFKQLNLVADFVPTGNDALILIARSHDDYGLVLLDLGLPDMDGLEVAQAIRALEARFALKPLHLCAVTGHNTMEKRRLCQEAGMDYFLAKPILLENLTTLLEAISH